MSLIVGILTIVADVISNIPTYNSGGISCLTSSSLDDVFLSRCEENNYHVVGENIYRIESQIDNYNLAHTDYYEPNDNFDLAKDITHPNSHLLDSYKTVLNSNLRYAGFTRDTDHYAIPLLADSHVSFSCHAYSGEYTLVLYSLDYLGQQDGVACQNIEVIYQNYSISDEKTWSFNLKAGTYVVGLILNTDRRIDYELELSISKLERRESIPLREARYDKGCSAAVWYSDLLYKNLPHYLYGGQSIQIGGPTSIGQTLYRDYALEKVGSLSNGDPVLLSQVYLWDCDVAARLKYIVSSLKRGIEDNFGNELNNSQMLLNFSDFSNSVNLALHKIEVMFSFTPLDIQISVICEATRALIESIHAILPLIFPQAPISVTSYIRYLGSLNGLLGISNNQFGGVMAHPIVLPCYYTLEHDLSNNDTYMSYECTSGIYQNTSDAANSIYESEVLEVDQNESGYCGGSFYLLRIDDSTTTTLSNALYTDERCEPIIVPLGCSISSHDVTEGGYTWFQLTAPYEGIYHCFFELDDRYDPVVELFDQPFVGTSTEGRIDYSRYKYIPISQNYVYLEAQLEGSQTIYARVRSSSWGRLGSGSFQWGSGQLSPLTHINHSYDDSYVSIDNTYHWSRCECGAQIRQLHVFGESWYVNNKKYSKCSLCSKIVVNGTGIIRPNEEGDENE
ncbi:MAG: hypothetical protein MJ241_07020 [Bacilli bacterium]|nr:hypothetical protein [Bacilli bacterium]